MRIKETSVFSEIKFSEGKAVPRKIQILRSGKFNHPEYGKFEINQAVLEEMKAHFDNRVRGVDIAFDYYHDSSGDASGWVKELILEDGELGTELWAVVDWTPKASQKLSDRELRYFSPDFAFQWKDPETGNVYKNVLFGGGLTNRPFLKEMAAITANEKHKGLEMTELEKAQQALEAEQQKNVKLSEEVTGLTKQLSEAPKAETIAEMKAQIDELSAKVKQAEESEAKLLAENTKLIADGKTAAKEKEFNVLLSEGKAVPAQKDAYMKGDMTEFIKLSQPVNLNARGAAGSESVDDETKKTLQLAEEINKKNPKMSRADAISEARRTIQNKK